MGWQDVKSQDELQRLGYLKDIAAEVSKSLGGCKVPQGSWNKLWAFIKAQRGVVSEEVPQRSSTEPINWQEVQSVDDLKKWGTFKCVKEKVNESLAPLKSQARGWEELYQFIKTYSAKRIPEKDEKTYTSAYFSSEASEILFYLLELDGEQRLKRLGVTKLHYKDKKYANEWKKKMMKAIHPDQSTHIKATEGTIELNKMYEEMIRYAK
ncbi:MAG: hypothetical protein ACRCW2_07265 [Cellulosilyticaceae bacterium]